ncbi:MAG: XrtA/PEP-CTERM system TPR-repeat protein PrsT [Steroidobacteraceae bacterium]
MSLSRAGSICTASVALLIAGCGVLLTPHYRLERAQREIQAGEWQEAAVDLKIVVEKQPNNAQAWLLLARISLDAGDLTGAASGVTHAMAAGAKGRGVDELRARVWVEGGQPQRLLDAVAQHSIELPEPDGTLATARALLALRQPGAALARLQPLLAAQPNLTAAQDLVAEALAAQGNFAAALQQLDTAMRHDPESTESAVLEGLILQQQGQYASAEDALKLALKRMPPAEPMTHRLKALIALTQVRLALGDLKAAAESEAVVAKLAPQSPATALLDARLKIAHKNLQGAVAELEGVLADAPGYDEARLLLGAALLQRGDLQQAQQQLQQVVENAPDDLAARKLLAEVQLKLGQPEGAVNALSPALATASLDSQLLSLYDAAGSGMGDKQVLIEALQRSEAEHPNDQTVLLNLGAAYLAAGQAQQALGALQKTVDAGDPQRDRLLIAALMGARGPDAAGTEVTQLLAAHPHDPAVLDLAASYYVTQGRTDDARAVLRTSLAIDPADVGSQVDLARLDEAAGDVSAAQSRLQEALKAHPEALPIRLALADVLTRTKAYDSARSLLEAAGSGAGPQVKFALAQVALASGDLRGANTAIDQALAARPGQAALVEDAGLLLMNANQYDAALARFTQATQLAPKDAGYWLNTARAQLARNQPAAARSLLSHAQELQPQWLPVVGALAYLDMRQGNGQAALARTQALLAQQPDDPGALELEGDVESYLRRPAAAETAYAKAQQLRPSARLAVNLYQMRVLAHSPEPQEPLEEWLAREPRSWPIRDVLGEYYLGAGKAPRRAAQELEVVIAQQPKDVVALNNLAWALNQVGDSGALAIAQRAYQLAPNAPDVEDTLGWVLTRNGRAADAVDYLRHAAKLDPNDANVEYHLAYALARTGHAAEARQILARILSNGQPFDSRSEAQQLMTSVKS